MIIARRNFLAGIALAGFHIPKVATPSRQGEPQIMTRYVESGGIFLDLDKFAPGPERDFAGAVADGDLIAALAMAKSLPDGLETTSAEGVTALLIATVQLNLSMVKGLLQAGENPNGAPGSAPICYAVMATDLTVARTLLDAGADPNGISNASPALYEAALIGNVAAGELLLQYHANIDEPDSIGITAAICAASADNYRMVLMLLEHGASIWATANVGTNIAQFAFRSRLVPTSPEYPALAQVIELSKEAGYPWPPPSPKQVRALRAEGEWPPRKS